MNSVKKQTLIPALAVLAALLLGACQGGSVDAVKVGDRSISRTGLSQLTVGIVDDDNPLPGAASGDTTRQIATQLVFTFAQAQYLESLGVVMSQGARNDLENQVAQNVILSTVDPTALDAVVTGQWIQEQQLELLQTQEAAQGISEIFRRDVEVDSRIGVWVADQTAVIPNGAADQSNG